MNRVARTALALVATLLFVPLLGSPATAAPPSTPTLVSPGDGAAVQVNPVLEWTKPAGATKFHIQISTTSDFSGGMVADVDTSNTFYTPASDLARTTFYWRVKAINATNEQSPYTSAFSFTKSSSAAPILLAPDDLDTVDYPAESVTLAWSALENAQRYDIEISLDSAFTPPLVLTTSTQLARFTVNTNLTFNQPYYWHVRGVSVTNQPTQWSLTRQFIQTWTAYPNLTAPPDQQNPGIEWPVLRWDWVPGAANYDVQIAFDDNFTNIVSTTNVKGTTYEPTTLANASYYWRVRGKTIAGVVGTWSPYQTFTKGGAGGPRITLIAPADDATIAMPTFSWTPFYRAAQYEIQFALTQQFEGGVVASCTTNHPEITTYSGCNVNFLIGQTYYWRVRPKDNPTGAYGLFSDVNALGNYWSFRYQPGAPVLTSPADGAATALPVLTWDPVPFTARYRVSVGKVGGPSISADTYNTSFVPQIAWDTADADYTWSVQPYSPFGELPWWSSTGSFTLTSNPGTAVPPDPLPGTYTGLHVPVLYWQPVEDAVTYTVKYYDPVEKVLATGLTLPAYAYTGAAVPAGTYGWRVTAYDGDDVEISTGTTGTFTVEQFQAPTGGAVQTAPAHCADDTCAVQEDTPTFVWEGVPGAGFYKVTMAADPSFSNISRTFTTFYPRVTPTNSFPETVAGQATYWYVMPCYAANLHCGPGPELFTPPNNPPVGAFRKSSRPITLFAPANNATLPNEFEFSWEDYLVTNLTPACVDTEPPLFICPTQEAATYKFEASNLIDFSFIIDSQLLDNTYYTPTTLTYPEGPIYWRVAAVDNSGNQLPWSEVRLVTKASPPPTLLSPANGSTVTDLPTFRWVAGQFEVRYQIEVYKSPGDPLGAGNIVATTTTANTTTAYTPTVSTTMPPGTYGWRIRRIDASGRFGAWTATDNTQLWLFTYDPGATTLISPIGGALVTDNSVLFQWSSVSNTTQYRVQTSASPTFAAYIDNVTTVMTTYATTLTYGIGTYYWRVQTLNNGLVMDTSATETFVRGFPVPGVPTGVTGVAGNGQVTVSWVAPADTGGTPVTGYTVTASPDGATCSWTSGTLSCTVTGLTNASPYTFTVTATTAGGTSPASAPSVAITPFGPPDAPTGVTGVSGNGQVTVSWVTPAFDGGSPVTGYTVTASPNGATCTWTVGPLSCVVSGLTNGTPYTFTVVATNLRGPGAASAASAPVTPQGPPDAPTGASGVAGNAQVTVSWTAPASNGGATITGYTVTAAPGGATCTWTVGPLSCTVSGLTNGSSYTFTVVATNVIGPGPASSASAAVTPRTVPDAPTGVSGVAGNGQVTVSWTAPGFNGGAATTGYTVTAAPGGATCTWTVGPLSCVVPGLVNGTAYTFTVTATNVAGPGAPSAASSAVTPFGPPGAPSGVTGVPGNTQVTVSWVAPASTGGAAITGYTVTAAPGGATCTWTIGPLSCTVSGLTNGSPYTFTVTATNAGGTGASSSASAAVTPRTTPGAPTAVSGVAGNGQVTVSWTAPASNGGAAITGYTVTASPDGATCTWTSGPLTCVVPGLTNWTPYTFTVVATNAAGPGPASAASAPVTPLPPGDWFHALDPSRILDSRAGGPQVGPYGTPWGPGTTRAVQVTGVGGVPGGADAVVLNVTVTGTTAASFLSIWPAGQAQPLVSSLNWAAGQTIPNAVTVKVGSLGRINVFNPSGNVHVIIDVVGYYDQLAGAGFNPLDPSRILDSRPGGPQVGPYGTPWGPGATRAVQVTGVGGVPVGADAVVLNVTVTGTTAASFLSIWPAGQAQPLVSSLNWSAGQTIPNAVTVKVGAGGSISVFNPSGNVDVIIDVVGFFRAGVGSAFHPLDPSRIQDSRPGGPQVGPYGTPWGPVTTRGVQVTGVGGVPGGAGAVLLNVTVTGTTASSFLSIWPAGQAQPNVSSLNWSAGITIPNAVTAKVGAGGAISVFNPSGNVDVIADVSGWYG